MAGVPTPPGRVRRRTKPVTNPVSGRQGSPPGETGLTECDTLGKCPSVSSGSGRPAMSEIDWVAADILTLTHYCPKASSNRPIVLYRPRSERLMDRWRRPGWCNVQRRGPQACNGAVTACNAPRLHNDFPAPYSDHRPCPVKPESAGCHRRRAGGVHQALMSGSITTRHPLARARA
jgi:hypothetical protein